MELKLLLSAAVLGYIDEQRGDHSRAGFIRHLLKDLANKNSSEQRDDDKKRTPRSKSN